MTGFRSWWETEGYGRHDVESCSEGLYVYTFRMTTLLTAMTASRHL